MKCTYFNIGKYFRVLRKRRIVLKRLDPFNVTR